MLRFFPFLMSVSIDQLLVILVNSVIILLICLYQLYKLPIIDNYDILQHFTIEDESRYSEYLHYCGHCILICFSFCPIPRVQYNP